jgi:IclR family transcriptional regulator, acetate operon repressor
VVRAGDLRNVLEQARRDGYALDDEEYLAGLRCVAAVVYNDQAEALAAISVSGLASRVPSERLPQLGRLVNEVAGELTMALGGRLPTLGGRIERAANDAPTPPVTTFATKIAAP